MVTCVEAKEIWYFLAINSEHNLKYKYSSESVLLLDKSDNIVTEIICPFKIQTITSDRTISEDIYIMSADNKWYKLLIGLIPIHILRKQDYYSKYDV